MIVRVGLFVLIFFVAVIFLVASTEAHQKLPKTKPSLPKDIRDFNAAFKKEVKASKNVSSLFQIGDKISPAEFYAGKTYLTVALFKEIRSKDPAIESLRSVSNLPSDDKKLEEDGLIEVYSNFISKSMYKMGALNNKNSKKLAKAFAKFLGDSYRKVSNEKYPRSLVTALIIPVIAFIKSQLNVTDALKDTFRDVYVNEWKLQDHLGKFPIAEKKIPPVRNPGKNPLLKPDPKACHVSKAVHQYHQHFQKAVESSKILSNLHTVDDSVSFSKGTEYMSEFQFQKHGVEDAAILADFMSKYVDDELARKLIALVEFCSVFIGKYLESELILNCVNAGSLASRFAKILVENAKYIVNEKNPRSKITAMSYGMFEFLRELRAFDASRGKKFAFFYGNEWKCLTRGN